MSPGFAKRHSYPNENLTTGAYCSDSDRTMSRPEEDSAGGASEAEFEVTEAPPAKTRSIIREIFDSELALWTVCLSGLWTYVWSSRKRLCLFNVFVLIPLGLATTALLSWILAGTITLGRVFFGNPEAANENSAVSWMVKKLPSKRSKTPVATSLPPLRTSVVGSAEQKSAYTNGTVVLGRRSPTYSEAGSAHGSVSSGTSLSRRSKSARGLNGTRRSFRHSAAAANGNRQQHHHRTASTTTTKEILATSFSLDGKRGFHPGHHRHLKVSHGYFWQRICPAPAYYEEMLCDPLNSHARA